MALKVMKNVLKSHHLFRGKQVSNKTKGTSSHILPVYEIYSGQEEFPGSF